MTTRVAIGCPVTERDWILPAWLAHIDAQRSPDLQIDVVCLYTPSEDHTLDVLLENDLPAEAQWRRESDYFGPQVEVFVIWDEETPKRSLEDIETHRWRGMQQYRRNATMRNKIADWVDKGPYDYFLSLDSDILLAPPQRFPDPERGGSLARLIENTGPWDVVAPQVNMDRRPLSVVWNYMNWLEAPEGMEAPRWAKRPEHDLCQYSGRHEVGAVIAAFLVPLYPPPPEQSILWYPARRPLPRWEAFPQGEDLGWPWNARERGYRMLLDTDLYPLRHVMNKRPMDHRQMLRDAAPSPWEVNFHRQQLSLAGS